MPKISKDLTKFQKNEFLINIQYFRMIMKSTQFLARLSEHTLIFQLYLQKQLFLIIFKSKQMLDKIGLIMVVLQCMAYITSAQEIQEIYEHVLYENIQQPDRSHLFYKMTVGPRYFTGRQHLTVKVMADRYDSDPDVYISRLNSYPKDSSTSEYYCEKEGSETCIVKWLDFDLGDTFYIGVGCRRECHYKMKIYYAAETLLQESERTQIRFDDYSTQILKYYIPADEEQLPTKSITIQVLPEDDYTPVEMWLSLDKNFYLIEEQPAAHVVDNAVAIKFGQDSDDWCTKCWVYVVLNVVTEQRYYITSVSKQYNDALSTTLSQTLMVNPFEQECYEYFVLRTKYDVRFFVYGYTGQADIYVAARNEPEGPKSNRVHLRAGFGSSTSVAFSPSDRKDLVGYSTGTYWVCIFAYSPFSGLLTTQEADLQSRYDLQDQVILTKWIGRKDYFYSRYRNSAFGDKGIIHINLEVAQSLGPEDEVPFIQWKICSSPIWSECELSSSQVKSKTHMNGAEKKGMPGMLKNQYTRHLEIEHDPSECPSAADPNACFYLLAFYNKNSTKIMTTSVRVHFQSFNPGDVDLTKEYQNVVNYGEFFTYEIDPGLNAKIQPYIKSLKIKLTTFQGDADIFLSLSDPNPNEKSYDLASRRTTPIDQVLLEDLANVGILNQPIYFSVYGYSMSQYLVQFEYEFMPTYDERLESAQQLGDGIPRQIKLLDEYSEGFYSYSAWWSGRENRTIVFLADVIFNKIFFYADWNQYPKHFITTKHDVNDTIAIYGGDEYYHDRGTYFIRLRPDFALYDLLSDREYIYRLYFFSQTPASQENDYAAAYETLDLGREVLGFSNASRYQDYRYFLVDMKASFNVTLKRLPGYGKPYFYVKVIDSDNGFPPRADNARLKSQPMENQTHIHVVQINETVRDYWPTCQLYQRSLHEDGRQLCFLAISVKCAGSGACAYKIKIEQNGFNNKYQHSARAGETFYYTPPGPIIPNDFINGKVEYGKVKYHYYPIDVYDKNMPLIFLNKTQIYGEGANGDTKILINIQPNISDPLKGHNYTDWIYPTDNRSDSWSHTGRVDQPEIIEPGCTVIEKYCPSNNTKGCGFIIGVVGMTKDVLSSYRIRAFHGSNRLYPDTPLQIQQTAERSGQRAMDYYWYIINDTVFDPNKTFDYQISVGSETGNDPDLYVAVYDGRWPTEDDWDFSSKMYGADTVRITSDDLFWAQKGYNTSAGVVVMVAVKFTEVGNYTLMLTEKNASFHQLERIDIAQTLEVQLEALPNVTETTMRDYHQIFQFYNWEHKNVTITLKMVEGNATVMVQKTGQRDYKNNIYTGLPITAENSAVYRDVQQDTVAEIPIQGDQCDNCWYFININIHHPNKTVYQLLITRDEDFAGNQYREMRLGSTLQEYIASKQFIKKKFILDSMDNFVLEATVASGQVQMFVGTDPNTVGDEGDPNTIWNRTSDKGIVQLKVKTTDKDFRMATWYYVKLVSISRRDALININLKQTRKVEFVPNNHDQFYGNPHQLFNSLLLYQKYQFETVNEQVKWLIFDAPPALYNRKDGSLIDVYYQATISIEPLTPHFYPILYVRRLELQKEPRDLSSLDFPNIAEYEKKFGENPNSVLHQDKFVYSFKDVSTTEYAFQTIALYQQNWGLTDIRKSEFQISISIDIVDQCEVVVCDDGGAPVGSNGKKEWIDEKEEKHEQNAEIRMPDGSLWKWIVDVPKVDNNGRPIKDAEGEEDKDGQEVLLQA